LIPSIPSSSIHFIVSLIPTDVVVSYKMTDDGLFRSMNDKFFRAALSRHRCVAFCPRTARPLTLLSWLRFEKLCLQLYLIVDFPRDSTCICLCAQTTGFTSMILFSGALKSLLRMEQCSLFPWLSSDQLWTQFLHLFLSSVGVSHSTII